MITLVDYGAGNIQSVRNTLEEIGAEYRTLGTGDGLGEATRIVLPGVGHFGQMMRAMEERGLRGPLLERVRAGVPLLGICVGLQCMFAGSEEAPGEPGLGLFPGLVRRFPLTARVPHMGWNDLERRAATPLLDNLGERPFVYFAHSYYAPLVDATAAACHYEFDYTAVLRKDNIHAVQFHPEKSGAVGLQVMRNFVERC